MPKNELVKYQSACVRQVAWSFLCWCMQIILCIFLLMERLGESSYRTEYKYPYNIRLVIARFVCSIALHMQLQVEVEKGILSMKFCLNHSYRFGNLFEAFTPGFMQASSAYLIEIVNLIVILRCDNVLETTFNFMACAIIAEFDDFFYSAQSYSFIKDIATNDTFKDLFKITRTTSMDAAAIRTEHLNDD